VRKGDTVIRGGAADAFVEDGQTTRVTALRLFKGLAGSYDRVVDYATMFQDRYWKRWVVERGSFSARDLVLDLGCGTLLFEQRMVDLGCRFVGVDLSEEMVELGRSKGLPNVPLLINGDAESLPFGDQSFDAAMSCYLPKYVDIQRLAGELARVVKPGGMVVFYDFSRPRGVLSPILLLYVRVGLPIIGFMQRLIGSDAEFAFRRLPRIIEETSWNRQVAGIMEAHGFETVETASLTHGVVFAYRGRMSART
jgi:ubiquinone/menaquinone biosynthesis C-methylase UbiE